MNYIIWWQPTKEDDLHQACPFLELENGEYQSPTTQWPNGFSYLVQDLDVGEFSIVNNMADGHTAIDIQQMNPTLYPPFSPTGR